MGQQHQAAAGRLYPILWGNIVTLGNSNNIVLLRNIIFLGNFVTQITQYYYNTKK